MEAICDPENMKAALRAVVRNKGAPGVDGITVRQGAIGIEDDRIEVLLGHGAPAAERPRSAPWPRALRIS
jgi:hypothetical protein